MKKLIAFGLLILISHQYFGSTLYNQLCEFNFNWKKYGQQAPQEIARIFNSDKELIQTHLSSVLSVLKSNSVSHLNEEQLKTRTHLIKVLDRYRLAGNFPQNYYREERIPVFIDEHDTHCAVGYLMQQSGNENLAKRISILDNYAWVKDIKANGILKWLKFSGFTLEELKLIQGAYEFYMPNALTLPNKYEVPQKPICSIKYFDSDTKKVWLRGEGENGILNGLWEQNYSKELPWIVGYFENGNRTGQWKEYYQGTNKLCRTENWRDDKLNGVRKRFNRQGVIIEEILFKDGNAITKINYDRNNSLKWIRKPLDSNLIWTEVFTDGGALIASGHERVSNPGNLLWFQNIELTALNSASITSRDATIQSLPTQNVFPGRVNLYSNPPLVEYKKEGDWVYYKEYAVNRNKSKPYGSSFDKIRKDYKHFGNELVTSIFKYEELKVTNGYDSIKVTYESNYATNFYGYNAKEYVHLFISYQKGLSSIQLSQSYSQRVIENQTVASIGQYNKLNQRIGMWKYYNLFNELYKTENFIHPELIATREKKMEIGKL